MFEQFLSILERIAVALESGNAPAIEKPAAEKPAPKKAAPKKAPAKKPAVKKKETSDDEVKYEDVANAFVDLVKAGSKLGKGKGREAAVEVLAEFGLESVPEIRDGDVDFADVRDALIAKKESL